MYKHSTLTASKQSKKKKKRHSLSGIYIQAFALSLHHELTPLSLLFAALIVTNSFGDNQLGHLMPSI